MKRACNNGEKGEKDEVPQLAERDRDNKPLTHNTGMFREA
jgi:hypothetical protein